MTQIKDDEALIAVFGAHWLVARFGPATGTITGYRIADLGEDEYLTFPQ